jgi:polysaccharide pyruvyl transferase WcaK-like protein
VGVSVREKSGVEICRREFGVAAEHHIDPTMLLEASKYRELYEVELRREQSRRGVFVYTFDRSGFAEKLVQVISLERGEVPYEILNSSPRESAEKWIAEIAHSSFVVTDSFHGAVFSILMHTPFVVVRNDERGAARIESLLEMFGLQDHLVAQIDGETARSLGTVNWARVDRVLGEERRKAQAYLCGVLA